MPYSTCGRAPRPRTALQKASQPIPAPNVKKHRWRTRRIEEIQLGDLVAARDSHGTVSAGRVHQVFHRTKQPTLLVQLSVQGGNDETVEVTSEHPFWTNDRCWTPARALRAGDQLTSLDDDLPVKVIEVIPSGREQDVFNFEVAPHHNYHVGRSGVLVHNDSRPSPQGSGISRMKPKYHIPFGAYSLEQIRHASQTGQPIIPLGLRPGLETRTSAEFWLMGQTYRQEYEACQDYANFAGHAYGLGGSLAEPLYGLGNRSLAILLKHLEERLAGWRRRDALPTFDDVDGWHPEGLESWQVDALHEHFFTTFGGREVDFAYAKLHKNLYDAPSIQGVPMGSGLIIFQPAHAIVYGSGGGPLPAPDLLTGRVPAIRVPGPWQNGGWHTLELPRLADKSQYDTGIHPYQPIGPPRSLGHP